MHVFLDANILFSAAASDSAVRRLVHMLFERRHECWVDEYVLIEARRNLAVKAADARNAPHALSGLETLLQRMRVASAQSPGEELRLVHWLPEKDRPVLAAAIRLRCHALVTGDRTHFGAAYGKTFAGVTVHTPRSLAELLLAQ
jgi:predicted nucleic acid-binding protein